MEFLETVDAMIERVERMAEGGCLRDEYDELQLYALLTIAEGLGHIAATLERSTIDQLARDRQDRAVLLEAYSQACAKCGEPFTADEWDEAHVDKDGRRYHAECCPECRQDMGAALRHTLQTIRLYLAKLEAEGVKASPPPSAMLRRIDRILN